MINPAIADLIDKELAFQDEKWGKDRIIDPLLMLAILTEELGEVARAHLEADEQSYLDELVDVAASAITAINSVLLAKETTLNG